MKLRSFSCPFRCGETTTIMLARCSEIEVIVLAMVIVTLIVVVVVVVEARIAPILVALLAHWY